MGQKQKQRTDEYHKRVEQNMVSIEVLLEVALFQLKKNIQKGLLVPYDNGIKNLIV